LLHENYVARDAPVDARRLRSPIIWKIETDDEIDIIEMHSLAKKIKRNGDRLSFQIKSIRRVVDRSRIMSFLANIISRRAFVSSNVQSCLTSC